MKKSIILLTAFLAALSCAPKVKPAIEADPEIEAKVEKVLKGMTIEQKAGQMLQLNVSHFLTDGKPDQEKIDRIIGETKVGSILNAINDQAQPPAVYAEAITKIQEASMREMGIPCLYGLDEIHGATYILGGVLFPQEINLASSFNRQLAADMGRVIAYETRSAMIPWTFSPVMDLGRDARWSRMWESFGEDSYVQAEMAKTEVRAIQGDDPNHIGLENIAVSIKHYMCYGAPWSGKDRTPAYLNPAIIREKYFRPFKECVQAGALNMMINSASINGVPMHANREMLTGWVKEDLGWDGMMITDWGDIFCLWNREHIAVDLKDAIAKGVNAGIDMIMEPYAPEIPGLIVELVKEGRIPQARLDDAVRRILRMKFRLGLFDHPTWDVSGYDKVGSDEFKALALGAALESEVLLKNDDNVLPLAKGTRILVTGPNANSVRTLNGGWSYTWQGERTDALGAEHNTILEAVQEKFGAANVKYVPGVVYESDNWEFDRAVDVDKAVAAARGADVILACIGENTYCETPGNTNDLNLSPNQKDLVKALAKTGKPIVLILNEGRPRIINEVEPLAKAVVDIMLPGNYGGDALAMLLAGEANFSAKLPFTYSKWINALHTYDYKVSEVQDTREGLYNYDAKIDVQWPFGHGLSYTTYEYGNLSVSPAEFGPEDKLTVEVTVANTGKVAGKEPVLMYVSDLVASVVPDVRRLRGFDKVSLAPGESKTVSFTLPAYELAFVGTDGKWRLEEGDFRIEVGGQSALVKCNKTKVWDTPNID